MKSPRVNATERTALATNAGESDLAGSAQSGAAHAAPYQLQAALAQLKVLKRALAASQDESGAARQQIDVVMETISRLRQKVMRLAKFGHETGDKLLQRVAQRLLCCIRGADTACRYGGDEFVVLLPEVDSEKSAAEVAQKLRLHLAKPYVVDDHSIAITASIGVAVYPGDGSTQNDLIRRADIAMYLAKACNTPQIRTLQPAAQN